MGWDRPLQGFFLLVEDADSYELLYSNLDDLAFVYGCVELPTTPYHFVATLKAMSLSVPDAMLREVLSDGGRDVGNRYVRYAMDGSVEEVAA
jgi:hypothetical protein